YLVKWTARRKFIHELGRFFLFLTPNSSSRCKLLLSALHSSRMLGFKMDRIVGIETEYGCLVSEEEAHLNSELWPAKVKNYLFRRAEAGTIDLHYRDYEEPPGNGGFLLNGGRLYLDMGHIEYASPECLHLRDLVTYEMAGDALLRE